jgi:hypothetical protein
MSGVRQYLESSSSAGELATDVPSPKSLTRPCTESLYFFRYSRESVAGATGEKIVSS